MSDTSYLMVPRSTNPVMMVSLQSVKQDLVTNNEYVIYVPLASYDNFGVVKPGYGLSIDAGVLSVDGGILPTKTSDLINDGEDGTSPYATQQWVEDYSYEWTRDYENLINLPQINGVTLIGNKTAEDLLIYIPTKTSDLTNDGDGNSSFVTLSFVSQTYQPILVSGQNIKTVGGQSILGSGDLPISTQSKYVLETSGEFGTFTEAQYNLLVDDTKNVVIKNGVEEYTLKATETNYRTYMAQNTPTDTTINHYAIYVNTSEEAVNFRHWSKEQVTPEASSVEWGDITGNIDTQTDLQTKFIIFDNKLNQNVEIKRTGNDFTYSGDTVTFNRSYVNLKEGTTDTKQETIALANSTTAGLMSPSDVQAISDLRDDVDKLKGRNIRLLFTAKDNPTAIEINAFVLSKGYSVSEFPSISVVVRGTNHIWRYTENPAQWLDYGVDTVNQATNEMLGIVKGSETNGKVYVENDGSMSVYGWTGLNNTVNSKASQNDLNELTSKVSINTTSISNLQSSKEDKITLSHKLNSDFVTTEGQTNKFVTSAEKNTWNAKQDALSSSQLDAVNSGVTSETVSQVATNTTNITNLQTSKQDVITKAETISDSPSNDKFPTESTIANYVASGNSGKAKGLTSIDLNTVTATGFYACNVCTNRPTDHNGVMLVLKNAFASDNLVQVYWTYTADVMWVRHKDLGNWKEWKKIVKSDELSTVATSGSYNDLSDQPTIPTVNNGTLTIKQGGTTKGTFSANQSGNVEVNLDAGGGTTVTVEDNLTSTSTTNALSANQGRVLKGLVDGKQASLSTNQLNAVNSGITSTKVNTYDNYSTTKQNTLNATQLSAVNSGVTSSTVLQVEANTAIINTKVGFEEDTTGSVDPSPFWDYYNKSEIAGLLSQKANTNLQNANATRTTSSVTINGVSGTKSVGKHLCIESWHSNDYSQGYRIYDDGYCEQWGIWTGSISASGGNAASTTISLNKEFANTNYVVNTLIDSAWVMMRRDTKRTTSFRFTMGAYSSSRTVTEIDWIATGYVNL